jgi:hypothetical protein
MVELFWRWLLIGALAFGGGQAALSLVERTVVADTGWATPTGFATALAFAFITPGPILILAPFIGFRVAGLGGAVVAAAGVFLVPWFLAAGSARVLRGATQRPWVRAFGRGAAPRPWWRSWRSAPLRSGARASPYGRPPQPQVDGVEPEDPRRRGRLPRPHAALGVPKSRSS